MKIKLRFFVIIALSACLFSCNNKTDEKIENIEKVVSRIEKNILTFFEGGVRDVRAPSRWEPESASHLGQRWRGTMCGACLKKVELSA